MKKTESKLDQVLSFDAYLEIPEELRRIAGEFFDVFEERDTVTVSELLKFALEGLDDFKVYYANDLIENELFATSLLENIQNDIRILCKYISE